MMKKISVILGSISDKEVMANAFEILERFGIPYEKRVISAHRALDHLCEYAKGLDEEGVGAIIAAAGGAAALPGVIAAMTVIPVIGVPIKSKSLSGLDSLLSIVQMPAGVPVATVSIDGAVNAALLAAEILSVSDAGLREKIREYRKEIKAASLESGKEL
ncbi:MAG: 5-(carboxyamino)imidazole ribonucleotide mutase [Bacillota bacterium]|nr:5-(carboxyamino)imidazole ribonucleotide mutase [Bacillota bacterium]HOA78005.1 5-(carboxyamino)imidazole ribonucleotide mutase [Bacilli bacterium]HPZ26812.1 5-(carboxyamino)imidazole ribonucleotide mutase [Bacilli bacterium]HQC89113.1 5-(carboxyamino)imidazole ribonucleotide mutase [Bacilli bacterium]